jgi:RIO kinase 2
MRLCLVAPRRLGRISFRQIKNKRDYLLHRKNASWMYMSRLAAIREFTYMKALYDHGFPVPVPYDQSRHTILMSFVDAFPFGQVREISHTGRVYSELLNLIVRLAEHGLIHADFNEFNLLIDNDEKITLIDFPQMVSTNHPEGRMFFERDVGCITRYFSKRFGYLAGDFPRFERDIDESKRIDLDKELAASGHAGAASFGSAEQRKEFEMYIGGKTDASAVAAASAPDEDGGSEDEPDEEALAEALGVGAEDLDGREAADDDEAERMARELQGELDQEERAAKKGVAAKKKSKKPAPQEESKDVASDDEEDDEVTSEQEEEQRLARMARKDARMKSHAQAQALKASRKLQEKERKKREREGGPPMVAAASAPSPAPAQEQPQAEEEPIASDDDDDAQSIASSAASMALSQLGLNSKNLLNIQLPKTQQRMKKTNRNKDRERKKIHATIKEHM